MKTREFLNGQWVTIDDQFRGYSNPMESARDYLGLLSRYKRYSPVLTAPDLPSAISAMGASGYATDPGYAAKLSGIAPKTGAQQQFMADRKAELMAAGAPEHIAELGARQSALETGWGRSLSGGQNFYGIKGGNGTRSSADVRMASADAEVPKQMQTPGNPATGKSMGLFDQAMMAAYQQAAQGAAPAPMPEPTLAQRMAGNPMLQIGLGILSNPAGYGGSPLTGIAKGMQQGLGAVAAQEQFDLQMQGIRAKRAEQEEEGRQRKQRSEVSKVIAQTEGPEMAILFEQSPTAYAQIKAQREQQGIGRATMEAFQRMGAEPAPGPAAAPQGAPQPGGAPQAPQPPAMAPAAPPAPPASPAAPAASPAPAAPPVGPDLSLYDQQIEQARRMQQAATQSGDWKTYQDAQQQEAQWQEKKAKEANLWAKGEREAQQKTQFESDKLKATAIDMLPQAEEIGAYTSRLIDEFKSDPNMDSIVGFFQGRVPESLMTENMAAANARFKQLQGQAFIQAREMLKGAGQITDYESKRAEDAYNRMSRLTSEKELRAAIDEFKDAVKTGVRKIRRQAGLPVEGTPWAPTPATGGTMEGGSAAPADGSRPLSFAPGWSVRVK